jgi:riboflavin kinase/FMN adenylyltransferase
LGLAVSLELPFTEDVARQEPMAFIHDVLYQSIGVHELVVGYDFRFGHRRAGTTELLAAQAATYGYRLTVVPPIMENGVVVSSSNIRRLLQQGQVEEAARLLGRPYRIEGPVVEGFRRGRTLGFPTANVRSLNPIVPQVGVYAVHVLWQEHTYPGVANVGYNPTFGNALLSVEAHMLDFAGNLYGETLRVEFIARLRDERKFASLDELTAQITRDVQHARALHAQRAGHS